MESNGWVVRAFQGALAAVARARSLVDALERAVRSSGTIGGAGGVEARVARWPGHSGDVLERTAALAARGRKEDAGQS